MFPPKRNPIHKIQKWWQIRNTAKPKTKVSLPDTSPLALLAFSPVPAQTSSVKKCSPVKDEPVVSVAVLPAEELPDDWRIDYFQVSGHNSSESFNFEDYGNSPIDESVDFPDLHDCPHSVRKNIKRRITDELQISRFEKIGEGGFGVVLKARSTCELENGSAKLYALKLLACKRNTPLDLKFFEVDIKQEKSFMDLLSGHLNIVQCLDILWFGNHLTDTPCFAVLKMEYLDTDLYKCLRQIKVIDSIEVLLRILQHIGGAVAYMAERNIANHDIKPDNIMVKYTQYEGHMMERLPTATFKVIDFGLAKLYTRNAIEWEGSGTFRYFSPEKYDTPSDPFMSDVYALGITALELFNGQTVWMEINEPGQFSTRKMSAEEFARFYAVESREPNKQKLYGILHSLLVREDCRQSAQGLLEELEAFGNTSENVYATNELSN